MKMQWTSEQTMSTLYWDLRFDGNHVGFLTLTPDGQSLSTKIYYTHTGNVDIPKAIRHDIEAVKAWAVTVSRISL